MRITYPYFRSSPSTLLRDDLVLLLRHTLLLPALLQPLHHKGQLPSAELHPTLPNALALLEQAIFLAATSVALVGAATLLCFGHAMAFVGWIALCFAGFKSLVHFTQKGKIVRSSEDWDLDRKHRDEKWLFVNGICVGTHWLQSNVDFLSQMFGRDVIGVRNRTYGFLFDLVQCLVMRDFLIPTRDSSPELYARARRALLNPGKTKVVLIAHSQGAIILSLVIDALIADLPAENFQKLEIYTFGNAANHFSSPLGKDGHPLIRTVEHFANELDFVAQYGVLNWQAPASLKRNSYYGKRTVFLRKGRPGHLLNQHYLEALDPSTSWPADEQGRASTLWTYLAKKPVKSLKTL